MLNELLNQMDGLKQDADILFVLTTNRPEQPEGALAAVPGAVILLVQMGVLLRLRDGADSRATPAGERP